jgi:hypothetical protein
MKERIRVFTLRNMIIFILGCLSFVSVFLIQDPVQRIVSGRIALYPVIIRAILLAMVAGFVQEFFKALPPLIGKNPMISGGISGAGFGIAEAAFILIYASSIYGIKILFSVAPVERLFAIIFHISSTGIIMWGYSRKRFIFFFLIIAIIHGMVDSLAFLWQYGQIGLVETEVIFYSIATGLFLIYIFLLRKTLRMQKPEKLEPPLN